MEVSTEIIKEADVLVSSFFMGIVLLLVYDQIRIFRRLVSHGIVWVGIEDVLFWIAGAVAFFIMLYRENSGYIRGFSIGGVATGMLLYHFFLSRWVVSVSVRSLRKILFVVSRPAVWTFRLVRRPAGKMLRFLKKRLKKIWKTVRMSLDKI